MDCTLVYAFIPNKGLESCVEQQAQAMLRSQWARAHQTMALEDQAANMTASGQSAQLEALIKSGRLWSWDQSSDD